MRCPKCGFTSFDYLDSCKKCGNDLVAFKAKHGLRSLLFPASRADKRVASPVEQVELPDETPVNEVAAATDFGYDFMDEPAVETSPAVQAQDIAAPAASIGNVPATEPAPIDFGYDFMGDTIAEKALFPVDEPAVSEAEATPETDDLLLPEDFSLDFDESEAAQPTAEEEPLFGTAETDDELPPLGESDDFSFFDSAEESAELVADEDLLAWEDEEDAPPLRKQPPEKEDPSDPFEGREPAVAGQVPANAPGQVAAPEFPCEVPEEVETLGGLLSEEWLEPQRLAAVAEVGPAVKPDAKADDSLELPQGEPADAAPRSLSDGASATDPLAMPTAPEDPCDTMLTSATASAKELSEVAAHVSPEVVWDELPEEVLEILPEEVPEPLPEVEAVPVSGSHGSQDIPAATVPGEVEPITEDEPSEKEIPPLLFRGEAVGELEEAGSAAGSSDAEDEASLVRRFGAFLADLLVLGVVQGAFLLLGQYLLAPQAPGIFPDSTLLLQLSTPYFLLLFLTCFGYFTLFHFLFGQTPGKILFGLGVETMDGARLTPAQAFLRSVGGLAALSLAGLGYATILFDAEGRGWNDRMAGTRVVNWVEEANTAEVEDEAE